MAGDGNISGKNNLSILNTLLKCGANPESLITGMEPGFPLINAAGSGSLQAAELLLKNGARTDLYIPQNGGTALQAAASQGHLEVAERLIESGADANDPAAHLIQHYRWPNSRTYDATAFHTPVQVAAKMNNLALLQILLKHRASVTACPVSTHI